MEASIVSNVYPLALTKPHIKHRKNMSLIHGSFNGYSQAQHASQPTSHFSNDNLMNNHLSLIHQSERFKPYDMKVRQNASAELLNAAAHHRISKSNQIVPQPATASKLYSVQRQQQHAIRLSNNGNSSRNDSHHRLKASKLNRHPNDMSIKLESIIVPEADKNNNTTLTNCNVTITNASNHTNGGTSVSSNGQHSPTDSNSLLPPIPSSLADSNSDSETKSFPKPFGDGFHAGISMTIITLPSIANLCCLYSQ